VLGGERSEEKLDCAEKDERVFAVTRRRRAWPLAGLGLAAVVNVLWLGVCGLRAGHALAPKKN
jgi:hypothetical protein